MKDKWKMNRAGLLNFWYYDEETFDFENGKLLLRGSNGSGKSVTMQSFLPVLLDGKKSPDRLDPFGSKSRRMEDYLLGEKEITDREERTGYLFLEYKKEHTNEYITTGIGMQAKRGKDLKSWGFVITDNRRIGHDLELYKMENQSGKKVKIPRSRIELENLIGDGGEVVKSNQEYMMLVNKHIFGFETQEAYEDLIKLLIQLRSPKLSKDYKPTVIYEILEDALPPLSDDDLRYLSDSIEQMDQTKQQIEQLDREVNALQKLTKAYDAYNHRILFDQITELKKTGARVKKEQEEQQRLTDDLQKTMLEIEKLEKEIKEREQTEGALRKTKDRLSTHRVWSLEEERKKLQQATEENRRKYERADDRVSELTKRERRIRAGIDEKSDDIAMQSKVLAEHVEDMEYESEMSAFSQHAQNASDFERHRSEAFLFDVWKNETAAHDKMLSEGHAKIQEFELLKEKMQQKQKEIGEEEKERDSARQSEKAWMATLSEDKQKKISEIHEWSLANSRYGIEEETFGQASRLMDELYEAHPYDRVKNQFHVYVEAFDNRLKMERLDKEAETKRLQEEKSKKNGKLAERKAQQDPEPERQPATTEARRLLRDQGVEFAPLYEVVEFQPDISPEIQKRIESALAETGLLDALVAQSDLKVTHDRVLLPNPNMLAHTLAGYLKPDMKQSVVPVERVEEILQSVLMGDSSAPIGMDEDGTYRLGVLSGHAVPVEEVRYIGREARKRHREMLIAELERDIYEIDQRIAELSVQKTELTLELEQSTESWRSFPEDADLRTSFDEIKDTRRLIGLHNRKIETLGKDYSELDRKYQIAKREVHEKTALLGLGATAAVYREALNQLRKYDKKLNELHHMHMKFIHVSDNMKKEQEILEDLMSDIDVQKGDLNVLEDAIAVAEKNLRQMEEQLALEGADDVRRQIRSVQTELAEVEEALRDNRIDLPARQERGKTLTAAKLQSAEQLAFWKNMHSSWEGAVQQEVKRGFIEFETTETPGIGQIETALKADAAKEKSQIEARLTRDFYEVQTDLAEHRMRDYPVEAQLEEWMEAVESDEWLSVIEQWKTKTSRRIVDFDKRGIQVTPYALYKETAEDHFIQENRLNEQDEELYKEILYNSVGNKLRSRIGRAEKWTEKMKALMESRDSSSGLKFSIKWQPRTADSEQELDTKELVGLLKQDARLLKDEDIERISVHFRSKIEAAKRWMEEKGEGQTLLQVLKSVLDYRKWFSFVLFYERTNEKRRELTNNKFFTFSGGEKAMAMYIPLFTACYSRYQEAADTAPYIISLDEAFAGVDENNIKEMFEIIEQLGFDYMMNSQVLWGDYETVSSLAVCELVRPKNADFVTVIRYKWDGKSLNEVSEGDTESVMAE
ncbi:TIGR02680 family protein [Planococcus salinarum]|uniref:TIGR02680 family protein n=2 Tax=Planococcus salinarum TaxID=622695 RepID=UPI000E3E771B|nr:TIGR02680 family protein [Planococcus salinarum]TAA72184.1 TIGR02680 family protein [Planococcus salinarum]